MLKRIAVAALLLLCGQVSGVTRGEVHQSSIQWLKLEWTNADVTACGAVTSCNILVGTLPARARSLTAVMRVSGAAVGPTTVTASVGRTASTYLDYIVASNAKAAATYGDSLAEQGTALQNIVGDVPSMVSTTVVNVQFVSTGANLSTVTGSAGTVWVRFEVIP